MQDYPARYYKVLFALFVKLARLLILVNFAGSW